MSDRDAVDAHNRREVQRMWRAAVAYLILAVLFAAGAFLAAGLLRNVLIGVAALFGAVTAWIAAWAVGIGALVRAARRQR